MTIKKINITLTFCVTIAVLKATNSEKESFDPIDDLFSSSEMFQEDELKLVQQMRSARCEDPAEIIAFLLPPFINAPAIFTKQYLSTHKSSQRKKLIRFTFIATTTSNFVLKKFWYAIFFQSNQKGIFNKKQPIHRVLY